MSLSVVTWLWGTAFLPADVNRLYRALQQHLHIPHTFWCITDSPSFDYLDAGIRTWPMFTDHGDMKAGPRACFRRLRIFDREMGNIFGPRILQLDLDDLIVDDVTPLFDRPEPVVMHLQNETPGRKHWNPSILLMDAGALHPIWERFHARPQEVWTEAQRNGWACSDMSVINDYLNRVGKTGPQPVTWPAGSGIVPYWRELRRREYVPVMPHGARMICFYGFDKAGDPAVQQRCPWVRTFWS